MKTIFAGLSLACLALAVPFYSSENPSGGSQVQLGELTLEDYVNYPGYDLNLNELRLVQLEGREPVWMTEYEKVCVLCQLTRRYQAGTDAPPAELDSSQSPGSEFL